MTEDNGTGASMRDFGEGGDRGDMSRDLYRPQDSPFEILSNLI